MHDQGFSFKGLSSVDLLLITVSKNVEKKLMKKDFAIFESVNYEKSGHSLKSLKIASSSLKDGLFENIITRD